ncbi:AfsR/SARP family transcriptional regulator [Actinokineospora bangkokensis]|uniref:OmpR/PhoB-type domain-containing protein n=1 Tax=Actinokineospora bangkokensis TaxID=1193682 RepID=A0A1Q9LKA4_9PSEU|nr:BTAD domain-containing putative transcriptional regulator [Actinokineospora bangkokensis]OLR92481.1 hypothetical protein BJP25_20635 [Actinokineospora bangkokensis]
MTERDGGGTRRVRARVLGELAVLVDGTPLALGHARQRAVLAALLVEADRIVPVDRLVERVWGADPPLRANSVVRTYMSHLRRALAPAGLAITWRGSGYQLALDPQSVDLHRFTALVGRARAAHDPERALELVDEALALWTGDALADVDTEWAGTVRDRLARERTTAAVDRVDWALALGRHREVLAELATRAEDAPLDERTAAQYVLALHRDGRAADALAHYQRVRERLAEQLGADPGQALRALHQRILTGDPGLDLDLDGAAAPRQDPDPGVADTAADVPRQLPAAPAPFVGRHAELDRIAAAGGAPVVISAISGAGGIGKTWLALHWAHRNAHRFPDGQLFVDLRGFSPDGAPMDPAVAVRGFLAALGVSPGRVPVDPHAQSALFRSLVARRRVLVVLDNAVDSAQVGPLLPGSPSCTVVVTSRNRLAGLVAGHGARYLPLDVLGDAEARALLVDHLGPQRPAAEPAAVAELIALCAGFPLALAIVAARAHTQPRLPLAAVTAELRELGIDALDGDDPSASLPAVLSWSMRSLSTEQADLFALLGDAAGPDFSQEAAAALAGVPVRAARAALRGLAEASLVTQDLGGRHRVHDLIRRYAADLDHPDRVAAQRRLVLFYLHTSRAVDAALSPHRRPVDLAPLVAGVEPHPITSIADALAWSDLEHANLLAAQATAAQHGWDDLVWQLAWYASSYHLRQGHRHESLLMWERAVTAAERLPHRGNRILAHRLIGIAHARLEHHGEGITHLHRALNLAEQLEDLDQQAHTHFSLARAYEHLGDLRAASDHSLNALTAAKTLGQPVFTADALNLAGWHKARLGDHDTAKALCTEALTRYRTNNEDVGTAIALDSLGYIAHHTHDHHTAVTLYQEALALFRTQGDVYEVATTLDNLGHPLKALGHHQAAREAWEEALTLMRHQDRTEDLTRVQHHLSDLTHTPTH